MEAVATISFEQAVFGATVPVTLRLPQRCARLRRHRGRRWHQAGDLRRVQRQWPGTAGSPEPARADGHHRRRARAAADSARSWSRRARPAGAKVASRSEHTYQVDVPAGVDSGSTLRLSGRGAAGPRGGTNWRPLRPPPREPHDRYLRDGDDLVTVISVSIAQAALGTTVKLPTLDGDEEIAVPAGSQPGKQFVLRQRGVPEAAGPRAVVICVPNWSSRFRRSCPTQEADLLRQLAELRGEAVGPGDKGLISRSSRRSSRCSEPVLRCERASASERAASCGLRGRGTQ